MNIPTFRNGKKPLSSKPVPTSTATEIKHDELFGNACALSLELQAELDAQGLVPRFVDAKRLYEMNGYHDKGWRVYKRESKGSDPLDFKYGTDPAGIIRRGSLILAVKTREEAAKHKKYLEQKAQRHSYHTQEQAKQLRDFARDHNLDAKVHEGYEENDGE